jgi:hypothetical protein
LKRVFLLGISGVRNILIKLIKKQVTVGTLVRQYRQLRSASEQFPEEYKRASQRFTRYIMRKYPDQAPFIPHFITLGYHYYMFTFDHVVPGLTELLKKEDFLAEASGLHEVSNTCAAPPDGVRPSSRPASVGAAPPAPRGARATPRAYITRHRREPA